MASQEIDAITQKAKAAYQARDYPTAIKAFDQAREAAKAAGDEPLAAEMANNMSVTFLLNKQPHEALEIARGTDLVFEKVGDLSKQGMALGNIGAALEELKQFKQAVDHYQRSIELLRQAGETEYRGLVQKSLATIQIRQGDHFSGMVTMHQSLEDQKRLTPRERWLKRLLKLPYKLLGK
jgi:tetratricopeptide (TPR) repeat protein